MQINKLNSQQVMRLSEVQKYFYGHLELFIQKLDEDYFIPDKTFYKFIPDKKTFELSLTPKNASEITIDMRINSKEIFIDLVGWHENFEFVGIPIDKLYEKVEKLLIFALSSHCKIIIYRTGRKPYKWSLYAFENGKWKCYSTTGSLIYNFFGKRTKEEKQSNIFKEAVYPKELFAG